MIPNLDETICAGATPPGFGAIGIVRLSGKQTLSILQQVFFPLKKQADFPKPRHVYLGTFQNGDYWIDELQAVYYKAPHSYTGEDMVEFFHHGSPFIQRKILETLIQHGARLAEPGEFTMRAFFHGKFDLIKAESINDLIFAEHEASHKIAMQQMRGYFSNRISQLRQRLIDLTALLEVEIDFSEEDIEFVDRQTLIETAQEIIKESQLLLNTFKTGNVLKNGIPVAIIGKPNVGKSTLLNRILNEDRVIVSDVPGTTRDYVEDMIYVHGLPLRFIDTAGIRHSEDAIEVVGINKTYEKAAEAEVILLMIEPVDAHEEEISLQIKELESKIQGFSEKKLILVLNKIDLMAELPSHWKKILDFETVFISAKRNENIDVLLEKIVSFYHIQPSRLPDVILTNTRHVQAFQNIIKYLEEAIHLIEENSSQDLVSQQCRLALHEFGQITGEITNEDILDSIFSRFCIGK